LARDQLHLARLRSWIAENAARLALVREAIDEEGAAGRLKVEASLPEELSASEVKDLARAAAEHALSDSAERREVVSLETARDREARNEVRTIRAVPNAAALLMISELREPPIPGMAELESRVGQGHGRALLARLGRERAMWLAPAIDSFPALKTVSRMEPQTIDALRDISAQQAVRIGEDLGPLAVNRAAPLIQGRGILAVTRYVGSHVACALMLRRKGEHLRSMAETFLSHPRTLSHQPPLVPSSLIVDTNSAISFSKQRSGLPMNPAHRAQCAFLSMHPQADLRIANVTCGEVGEEIGDVPGVLISVSRDSEAYLRMLERLEILGVGSPKGTPDRGIIADAFFAVTEPGVIAKVATQDRHVYNALGQAAPGVTFTSETLPARYPGGFLVNIEGRVIRLIPIPSAPPLGA
jgi:hypothetical protein